MHVQCGTSITCLCVLTIASAIVVLAILLYMMLVIILHHYYSDSSVTLHCSLGALTLDSTMQMHMYVEMSCVYMSIHEDRHIHVRSA